MGPGAVSLYAVTAVVNASGAAAYMGNFYPAFQLLLSKSLFEVTLKLSECALDIKTARARINTAEES